MSKIQQEATQNASRSKSPFQIYQNSTKNNFRKTYFRCRDVKRIQTNKTSINNMKQISATKDEQKYPRRGNHIDFYSYQKKSVIKLEQNRQNKAHTFNNNQANQKMIKTNINFYTAKKQQNQRSFHSKSGNNPQFPSTSNKNLLKESTSISNSGLLSQRANKPYKIQSKTSVNFYKKHNTIDEEENSKKYLNKYQIIKELGKGAFSVVYLARKISHDTSNKNFNHLNHIIEQADKKKQSTEENEIERKQQILPYLKGKRQEKGNRQEKEGDDLVAIKVYQKFKMNVDAHKFKNIRKQINIMQNLNNKSILKIIENVQTLTKINLVVEYGGQHSLLEYLKLNFPLTQDRIQDISFQLIKAIAYMHQKNICHRDIKLQNILVRANNIKLIDFGFSCLTHKHTKLNAICGTPNYMAPEILSRKEYIGEEADIWSYGVVVYALAEGRHPFKAENYNQLERLVNKGKFQFKNSKNLMLIDFIRKILRVKPHERPRAKEILQNKWFQVNNFEKL